jgi:hypothetical protein
VELLTPQVQVWNRLWWVQAGSLAGLVLSLAMGGAMTRYWMHRNYQPVRHLLTELARRTGSVPGRGHNEFRSIESAMISAFEQRYQAMERFERHKSLLQENLMARMLTGAPEPGQDWGPSLQALDMDATEPGFLVVLLERDWRDTTDTIAYQRTCREALAAMVGSRGSVWPAAAFEDLLFVINFPLAEGKGLSHDLLRSALSFTPLLSEAVEGWDQLPQALSQVRTVRDHRYSQAGSGARSFAELPSVSAWPPYPLTTSLEEKLLLALRSGNEAAASEVLDNIESATRLGLAPQEARILVSDLESCFLKAHPQGGLDVEGRQELLVELEAAMARKTIEESLAALRILARGFCSRIRMSQDQHHDRLRNEQSRKLVARIQSHLQSRFRDPQLSLTAIAEELGVFRRLPVPLLQGKRRTGIDGQPGQNPPGTRPKSPSPH